MGGARSLRANVTRLLVALSCFAVVESKFIQLGDGFCRTASNGQGTSEEITVAARENCQVACLTQETCVAFEFKNQNEDDNCELHTEEITQTAESDQNIECFIKEFVPFFESKGLDVGVMVSGVFIMHVAFVVKTLIDNCCKWRSNQQRRRMKRASRDVRILFDRRGAVTKDNFNSKELQQLERIVGLLRTLAGCPYGNQTLFKCHKSICAAREVADRCAPSLRNPFISGDIDPVHTNSFDKVEAMLNDLMDRKNPQSTVVDTLNEFKAELAVLYAAYGADAPWITSVAIQKALVGGSGLFGRWSIPGFQKKPRAPVNIKS
jgi:hypothetical protein